jgi:prevent-host-death family protein
VPAIPGTIELSGKTGGGLVHSVAAGALAGVRLTANIPTETVTARSALRREDLDRTLPDGITPSTGSSYVSDEFAEKPVPEGETSHLRQIEAAALSDLVDRTVRERERFILTRNGRPAAVLLSPEDLESLEQTVDILQDRPLLDSIRRSRREAAEGKRLGLKDHL